MGDKDQQNGTPVTSQRHPPAIWFFFWGEFAERSSYYGMRAILFLYMTMVLKLAVTTAGPAYSAFKMTAYILPLAGGYIADRWLGRYWTIVGFSVPYVLGHFILGIPNLVAVTIALFLLACGSGVIKPNISTLMGETYDEKRPGNERLRSAAFMWFYFSINIGALLSQFGLPVVRQNYILNHVTPEVRADLEQAMKEGKNILELAPPEVRQDAFAVAFTVPAWLMVGALAAFAAGKPFYAKRRPQQHVELSPEERALQRRTLGRLFGIFGLVVIFWVGYEHNDTLWVDFIEKHVNLKLPDWRPLTALIGETVAPDQLQFLNALFVIILVPTFTILFGRLDPTVRVFTAYRKVLAGFIFTAAAVGIMAAAALIVQADPSAKVSVYWPAAAYIVLTFGEVLLYGTMLEQAYAAAPKSMKGFVSACFLVTNALGNLVNMGWTYAYGTYVAPGPFFAVTAGAVVAAAVAYAVIGKQFERSRAAAAEAGLT
jgi:POT family proton-dependent oligopeptide transporter